MVHIPQIPSKSLSPALLMAKPSKAQFEEFKTKLSALDKEIDQLVYALYDLTPEEIAIVEGKAAQVPTILEGVVA